MKHAGVRLTVVLTLLAIAVVALVITDQSEAQEPDAAFVSNMLISANRTHLKVCVDWPRGTEDPAGPASVSTALASLTAQHAERTEYQDPEVIVGCAKRSPLAESPPVPTEDVQRHLAFGDMLRAPARPSESRAFVYLVLPNVYADYFGDAPYTTGTAEMYCEGHVCSQVTTSLYLPTDAGSGQFRTGLEAALGLLALAQQPTPDFSVCLYTEPPAWCGPIPTNVLPILLP